MKHESKAAMYDLEELVRIADMGYLAGVIDSDGSISIGRCKGVFQERITIGQKQKQAIDLAKQYFGGYVHAHGSPPRTRMWYWEVRGTSAKRVLTVIRPFLRIKARQADIAMELRALYERPWAENYISSLRGAAGATRRPEFEAEQFKLAVACRALNDTRWPLVDPKAENNA